MVLSFKNMWFEILTKIQNTDKIFVMNSSVQGMLCVANL